MERKIKERYTVIILAYAVSFFSYRLILQTLNMGVFVANGLIEGLGAPLIPLLLYEKVHKYEARTTMLYWWSFAVFWPGLMSFGLRKVSDSDPAKLLAGFGWFAYHLSLLVHQVIKKRETQDLPIVAAVTFAHSMMTFAFFEYLSNYSFWGRALEMIF